MLGARRRRNCTHEYPARTLSNVLLPQPDGPMMAVSCPDWKLPLMPCKISFLTGNKQTTTKNYCKETLKCRGALLRQGTETFSRCQQMNIAHSHFYSLKTIGTTRTTVCCEPRRPYPESDPAGSLRQIRRTCVNAIVFFSALTSFINRLL